MLLRPPLVRVARRRPADLGQRGGLFFGDIEDLGGTALVAGVRFPRMNLIYLDEAGIAGDDPVTTVCGVIVRDDGQWQHAVDSVGKVIAQHVPASVLAQNGGFIPHATQIMEDDYRSTWPLESRAAFLHDLLFVPYHSALTVVWAYTRSTYRLGGVPKNIRPEAARHAFTFQLCVGDADECIRNALPMPAAGVCICEDTDKRNLLRWITSNLSRNPLTVPGMAAPYRVERMIDTVHFVKKGQAPLTALADVCAWIIKRYVGGNTEAEPYVRTLLATIPFEKIFLNLSGGTASGWFTPAYPDGGTGGRTTSMGFPSQRGSAAAVD